MARKEEIYAQTSFVLEKDIEITILKKGFKSMDERKYFEDNTEIGKYLFYKFREALKKS